MLPPQLVVARQQLLGVLGQLRLEGFGPLDVLAHKGQRPALQCKGQMSAMREVACVHADLSAQNNSYPCLHNSYEKFRQAKAHLALHLWRLCGAMPLPRAAAAAAALPLRASAAVSAPLVRVQDVVSHQVVPLHTKHVCASDALSKDINNSSC